MLNEPDAKPKVCYIAFLREEQKDVIPDFEQLIYSHWDTAAGSPPKARAVEPLPDPDLQLLSWTGNAPRFPSNLLEKFAEGTAGHNHIVEMRKTFLAAFPDASTGSGRADGGKGSQAQRTIRATDQPDFSVDGGAVPVDLTEELRPAIVKEADFSVTRRGVGVVWQFLYVVSCIMVFMKCVSLDASFLADVRVWNLAGRDMLLVRVASRPL